MTKERQAEALEDCSAGLEEPRVAGDELRQQRQELAAARQALEAERRRYRELFEFAPDCYLVTDIAGTIQEANRAAATLLHVSQRCLVGEPLAAFVADEEHEAFRARLARLRNGGVGELLDWELQMRPREGAPFWAAIAVAAARDPQGRQAGLRWLIRDITERKKSQGERERLLVQVQQDRECIQELAEAMERERHTLHVIMENTHAHLAYLDPQFNFVRVNSAYAQGAGYSEQELIGRNHFELFPHPENQAIFERVRETGEPTRFHAKPFVYPDRPELGTTYWDWTLVPVKDGNGQVRGLVLSLLDVTERRRAEKALEESERKYRQLVESLHEGIWVIDKDAYTTYVNARMAEILGYTVDEMQGRHLFSFMDARSVEVCKYDLERRQRGIKEQHDFEFIRKDGTRVYALLETSPITDDDGNYIGAIAGVQDITQRRRVEKMLESYTERLELLRRLDMAILAARSAEEIAEAALRHLRRFVPCLRASVAAFDFGASEMSLLAADVDGEIRMGEGMRLPLESLGEDIERLGQGEVHLVEDISGLPQPSPLIQTLRADGVRSCINVPLIAQGELMGSLNLGVGSPGGFAAEHVEIASEVANQLAIGIQQARLYDQVQRYADELERRVARRTAELRASKARFQTIFDGAAIGIALVDLEGRFVESNPALQEMLGYSGEELCGRAFAEFTHPDDATVNLDRFGELIAGKRDQYRLEKRYIRKDGQLVWANLTVSLVRGTGGRPQFAIGMVDDITRQKQTQAALLQAEKLTIAGKLAASLAHEINNPLQSIIGCMGLAKETLAEGGDVGRYLQVALEELRRVAGIVAQLRDLHRPSEPEAREPVDVNALLEKVLTLSRKKCEEHAVELAWRPAADLPPLMLVLDRMQQVFLNLLLNALDAMPEGGRLQVSSARTSQPPGVRISFADSGAGIAPDVLPLIFDPFYSTRPDGLGLGLFISRDIVRQHGGHIEVDSQVGKGTVFTVWLPARTPRGRGSSDGDRDRASAGHTEAGE